MVREYRSGSAEGLPFRAAQGGVQRLANGNTLITESMGGRAFEVTRDGKIVWEFVSPHRAGDANELVAVLLDVVRLPPSFPLEWLHSD